MPRGGRRNGKPGALYPNRSDLPTQAVRTAPGQPYGAAKQQSDAQHAIPLPSQPAPVAVPVPPAAPAAPPEPGLHLQPSARPGEPVTAGLPIGAGPGPEANAQLVGGNDQVLANLYQAYKLQQTEGLRAVIDQLEQSRRAY